MKEPKPRLLDPKFWERAGEDERELVLRLALRAAFVGIGFKVVNWVSGGSSGERFMVLQHGASETLKRIRERWLLAEQEQAIAEDRFRSRRGLEEVRARHTAAVLPMRKREA